MLENVQIESFQKKDIASVTELIMGTLKKSLIQKLGANFIEKYFLPACIQHPEFTQYVCRYENKIIGFLLFANNQQSLQLLGKKLFLPLMGYAMIKSITSPNILFDLAISFYNPTKIKKEYRNTFHQCVYLVYFCIAETMQNRGVGAHVLEKCLENLSPAGCIVETREPRAVRFYEKQQFIKMGYRKRGWIQYPLLLKNLKD